MYNHLLDTFITVTDCGSFTKAAEKLYISPTTVMKQINPLQMQRLLCTHMTLLFVLEPLF